MWISYMYFDWSSIVPLQVKEQHLKCDIAFLCHQLKVCVGGVWWVCVWVWVCIVTPLLSRWQMNVQLRTECSLCQPRRCCRCEHKVSRYQRARACLTVGRLDSWSSKGHLPASTSFPLFPQAVIHYCIWLLNIFDIILLSLCSQVWAALQRVCFKFCHSD